MALTPEDLKVLADVQMHTTLAADLIVDMIKRTKVESLALQLGATYISLRRAATAAQGAIGLAQDLKEHDHGIDA